MRGRVLTWLGIVLLGVTAAGAPAPDRSGQAHPRQAGPKRITTAIAGEPFTLSSTIELRGAALQPPRQRRRH